MRRYILTHPWAFALAVLFGILSQAGSPVLALVSMNLIDAVNAGDASAIISFIPIIIGAVALFTGTTVMYGRLAMYYNTKMALTLKKDLFRSVLGTKISDFNHENTGNYVSVMNNDIGIISQKYFNAITEIIKFTATVAVSVVVMITIHPVVALVITVMSLSPFLGPLLFSKQLARTQLNASAKKMLLNQKIKDYLSGFEVIKTFGVEKNIEPKFLTVAEGERRAVCKAGAAAFNVAAVTLAAVTAVSFLTYVIAGFFVLRGDITIGAVVAVVSLSGYIQQPIHMISNNLGEMKSAKGINERVLKMMEKRDGKPRNIKINGLGAGVTLENVTFSYADNEPVLKNISYHFKRGKKYAIVGHSGSGKSTLTKLIMGYYDNYTGSALLNNASLRDIDRESLCGAISVLPQNVFLLDDTLKNNITLYNPYSHDEYQNAVEKASLCQVADALPRGADTVLGEGGNIISYGERQRVAIARALLKGSDMLIMDEATANLDNAVAHSIEKSIVEMDDLTCIFVTHRYSKEILTRCDGILVMKNGELFEHGTFDELYEAKGYFHSLYSY